MSDTTTMFDEAFDPTTEEGTSPRKLLPPGRYRAQVTDASVAETKNGKGTLLNLTWQIIDSEHSGRMVFQMILIRHESAEAQRFGRQKLKDLCTACGITDSVTDVTVFYNKPCMITLGIERDRDGVYDDKNKVGRIAPAGKATMSPPAATPFNDKIPF